MFLDTIWEAIEWFQPHQPGDAILVLTMGKEGIHQSRDAKLGAVLVSAHIRLFGVQLGPSNWDPLSSDVLSGQGPAKQMHIGMEPVTAIGTGWTVLSPENLFTLSRATGGFASLVNVPAGSWKQYQATDERLKAVSSFGLQQYKAVTEYYRIRLQLPPDAVYLGLSESTRKQLPEAKITYAAIAARNCTALSTPPNP